MARSIALVSTASRCVVSKLIDCKRFSTLLKLLRVTALVLRAVEKFKNQKRKTPTTAPLTVLTEAELPWVKAAQWFMSTESNFESYRRQFNLFTDEKGLWHCEGRLSNAEVP